MQKSPFPPFTLCSVPKEIIIMFLVAYFCSGERWAIDNRQCVKGGKGTNYEVLPQHSNDILKKSYTFCKKLGHADRRGWGLKWFCPLLPPPPNPNCHFPNRVAYTQCQLGDPGNKLSLWLERTAVERRKWERFMTIRAFSLQVPGNNPSSIFFSSYHITNSCDHQLYVHDTQTPPFNIFLSVLYWTDKSESKHNIVRKEKKACLYQVIVLTHPLPNYLSYLREPLWCHA